MFEHSVKVPRIYKLASNIVRQVKEEGASLKSLVFQEKNKRNHKLQALFALVLETVKHDGQLNELLTKTGLLVQEPRFDPWLARILLTELLWGKQCLLGESKPVKTIQQYHDKCVQLLDSLESTLSYVNSQKVIKPRYIRINTLRLTAADAVRSFQDEGWNFVRCTSGSYNDFLKQVENLKPDDFLPDYHVKVVFVFPSNTSFYDHPLYNNGEIFLQDKATCLAGHLLAPQPGSTVLDMCAAPGMKTTHIAAIMKNEGTIYSVEQNKERYDVLCSFVELSGASCVKVLNMDAAALTKVDCPSVDYILLDPSCSGSGIHRPEKNNSDFDLESGRVKKLAGFQAKLLRHALNEFRTAKRVVYSTCSMYPQENEEVIQDVLLNHKGKFQLVSVKDKLNNNWNNFGNLKYDSIGEKCLYARSESDYTSGFFLAIFERTEENDSNVDAEHLIKNKARNGNNENFCNNAQIGDGVTPSDTALDLKSKAEVTNDVAVVKIKKKKKRGNEIDAYVNDDTEHSEAVTSKKSKKYEDIGSTIVDSESMDHPKNEIGGEVKKKKKHKRENVASEEDSSDLYISKMKSSKTKQMSFSHDSEHNGESAEALPKKKKNRKNIENMTPEDSSIKQEIGFTNECGVSVKKKKRRQNIDENIVISAIDDTEIQCELNVVITKKKKNKDSKSTTSYDNEVEPQNSVDVVTKVKKSKKNKTNVLEDMLGIEKKTKKKRNFEEVISKTCETEELEIPKKKKKSSKIM